MYKLDVHNRLTCMEEILRDVERKMFTCTDSRLIINQSMSAE